MKQELAITRSRQRPNLTPSGVSLLLKNVHEHKINAIPEASDERGLLIGKIQLTSASIICFFDKSRQHVYATSNLHNEFEQRNRRSIQNQLHI
jgi:hypothetical protein